MGRSKKNWDHLVDQYGNYLDPQVGNVGVARNIAGFGIKVDPNSGVGNVRIDVDPSVVVVKGDNISELNNDVGYITQVDYLNDIGNVTSVPSSGDVLTYDGASRKWVARGAPVPDAFSFKGLTDVEDEFPFADPKSGDFHIQRNAGQDRVANSAWIGSVGEIANVGDVIMYNTNNQWEIVANGFDFAFLPDDIQVVDMGVDGDKGEKGGRLEYESHTTTFYNWRADFSHLPDLDEDVHQPGTLDDRYVNANGDTMTGHLTMTGANINFTTPGQINTEGQYLTLRHQGTNSLELFDETTNFVNRELRFLSTGRETALQLTNAGLAENMELLFYGLIDNDKSLITREYHELTLEAAVSKYLPLTGGVLSGPLSFSNSIDTITFQGTGQIRFGNQALLGDNLLLSKYTTSFFSDTHFIDGGGSNFLSLNGSGNDGEVKYTGPVAVDEHVATKKYVDDSDDIVRQELADIDASLKGEFDDYYTKGESDARFLQNVTVNSTTTGLPGTDAQVTASGLGVLDFVIPRGDKGEPGQNGQNGQTGQNGQSCTVTAGSASRVGYNSPPTVTNSGTTKDAVFNFGIPEGQKGEPGQNGGTGATGAKGDTGAKGNTGGKGQKGEPGSSSSGSYVTRGSGTSMTIELKGSTYYITGG